MCEWLTDNFTIEWDTERRFDWCRNPDTNRHLPFDIVIDDIKLIIEIDGRQHYLKKRRWLDPRQMQLRDTLKMMYALEHGWTIVRIVQEDIWNDRNNWSERLRPHLRKHRQPRCILLDGDKGEYNDLRVILADRNIARSNV